MDKLNEWLAKVEARQLWTQRVPHVGRIDCYQIGKGIALVQIFKRGVGGAWTGFEIYVPASLENRIDGTLEAAELALGISERPVHPREVLTVLSVLSDPQLRALSDYVKARIVGSEPDELEGDLGAEIEETVGDLDSSDLVSFGKIIAFEIAKRG